MDKMLYLAILLVLGVFFMKKMMKPPVGPSYRLKSIFFTKTKEEVSEATSLGKLIFTSRGKRKILLPTEKDLWTEINLFENGIVLKKNRKEKTIFFSEIRAIEPFLVNSLFVKGKYFGYEVKLRSNEKIKLKSCDLWDLDVFIEKLCELFPPETGRAAIMEIK